MEPPGAPSAYPGPVPFTRRCSAHAARRSNSPGSFPPPRRAPSGAPSSPRKRRRSRKGYAERVDRRHGSLASSHGRFQTRSGSSGRWRSPPAHGQAELASGGDTRSGRTRWRALRCRAGGADHLGDTRRASGEWARPATVVLVGNHQEIPPATEADATVPRANADRGGSLARRRIHGSRACPRVEHALQRSVVQSQPREARMNLRRLGVGALHRTRVNHVSGSRRVGGGSGRG